MSFLPLSSITDATTSAAAAKLEDVPIFFWMDVSLILLSRMEVLRKTTRLQLRSRHLARTSQPQTLKEGLLSSKLLSTTCLTGEFAQLEEVRTVYLRFTSEIVLPKWASYFRRVCLILSEES